MSAYHLRKSGQEHPRWRGGVTLNGKGYRRIMAGPHRGKYEHRKVMEDLLTVPLCAGYVFPGAGKIPPNMTVEHIDHQRAHNCHSNLMLLDSRIHNAITAAGCRYVREHYDEWLMRQAPDWVTETEVA